MFEYVGNLHTHTTDSDGHGSHDQVAEAALHAELDFVIVTDHNVYPAQQEAYHFRGEKRLLMLIGQEVHDAERMPERSHLLVYGAAEDLSAFAGNPQELIDKVADHGGLAFLAHPADCGVALFDRPGLPWADWQVRDYTGLEIWNFMSEFKCRLTSWPRALYFGYFPSQVARGPANEVMERWDAQLGAGLRTVAIGGADAHAMPVRVGPLRRVIFPYRWLFGAINTHVLLTQPLTGDLAHDRALIYAALRTGRCWVGYDRDHRTAGFRFSGQAEQQQAVMGEELRFELGATLQVRCPRPANIRIIRHGSLVRSWDLTQHAVLTVKRAGAYRVEARLVPDRGWIYSNPIHLVRDRR